jgi:transcriptional regulator with XRE-family HTH domain
LRGAVVEATVGLVELVPWTPELRKRLRAARGYADMSQPELAEHFGWSRSTIVRIEEGTRSLKDYELGRIAEVCDLPIGFFSVDFSCTAQGSANHRR